jgi:hypothetical protein
MQEKETPLKKKRIESVKRHREWQKMLDKEKFFLLGFFRGGSRRL